ncbi:MAG: serine/threonine protein kinase, partial [Anaeromyxobacteraceae bacterium]|nr:serine/threonine protein kinase [Anaeromyxobacteraceae bacterium]
ARRVDVVMPGTVEASDLAADGALALSLAVRTQAAEAGRRLAVALLSPDPPPEPAPAPAAEPQASDDGSRYAGPPAD